MIFVSNRKTNLRGRFAESFDALGAQRFFDQTTFFHNRNFLEVRFERAIGGALGERAIVTKSGCFAAVITFCHC